MTGNNVQNDLLHVMRDRRLSLSARTIYAYLYFFVCSDGSVPDAEQISADLGMGLDTFYRHFRSLKEAGLIIAEQRRGDDGRMLHSAYSLPPLERNGGVH